MRAKMERPAVRRDLERIFLGHLPSLLSLQFCTPGTVRDYVGRGPLNSEDRPLLEYGAPRSFFLNRGTGEFYTHDERMTFDPSELLLARLFESLPPSAEDLRKVARLHAMPGHGNYAFAYSLARRIHQVNPKDSAALHLIADVSERMGKQDEALQHRRTIAAREPDNPASIARYAWMVFSRERPYASRFAREEWPETEALLRRAIELSLDTVDMYRFRLGSYYYETQRYAEAADSYRRALEIRQDRQGDPAVSQDGLLLNLARALERLGEPTQAVAYAAQAALQNPANRQALEMVERLRPDRGEVSR
jgi:tetratricopeptide (TPR) repeat protein